jgi:predicted ribosome quality control (RQC) complex YloA/Tae2 family protein
MKQETHVFATMKEPVIFYIGQSQQENHDVIDRGKPTDLWCHLANTSSAHVVACLPPDIDRKQRGAILRRAALLCKIHTAKAKSLQQVAVTYATIQHVQKTQIPGQVTVQNPGTLYV